VEIPHPRAAFAFLVCLFAAAAFLLTGCPGGVSSPATSTTPNPTPQAVSLTINPSSASIQAGAAQQFSAHISGASNTSVNWTATGGTISSTGLYTASTTAGNFAVTATSVADSSKTVQAKVTITQASPPPPPPTPGSASSITKDGITWTFSHSVPVGQFVTGDYYVVGPVTITSIDPPPTTSAPYENGSALNLPTPDGKSGFDSRLDNTWFFSSSVRSYPPITLQPGDALVSSISLSQSHLLPEVMRASDKSISPVGTVSVLTVLPAAPPTDAFRPSYCDRNQTIYHASALQRDLLLSLAPPNPSGTPTLAQFEVLYRRPWIDTNDFLFDTPAEYMPSYGMHVALADSYASLLLNLNFPADQKINLTNYFVQYGIDLYGCLRAGRTWPAFGGHRSGRKLTILFAGILLNDAGMKSVGTLKDSFGEDMQTVYVKNLPPAGSIAKAWQGATVIYGGHYGVHADGTPVSPGLYGPYEQLQPSAWPLISPTEQLGEAYRRCCTSIAWVGEALTIHLLHAESLWNYPAFFDYVDRWMTENDAQAVAEIKAQSGFDYSPAWDRQGQTHVWLQGSFPQYTFIDDMWKAYR
jgi:hypothetical protein